MINLRRALTGSVLLALAAFVLPTGVLASTPNVVSYDTVTDGGLTIYWYTRFVETGSVALFTNSGCSTAVSPAPSFPYGDQGNGYSHYIVVQGLSPSTNYYYKITSGGTTYSCSGPVKTFATLSNPINPPFFVEGYVGLGGISCNTSVPPAPGTVISAYFTRTGVTNPSTTVSTVTGSNGNYALEFGEARTSDGSSQWVPANGDVIHFLMQDGNIDPKSFTITDTGASYLSIAPRCLYPVQNFDANAGFEKPDTYGPWAEGPGASRVTTSTSGCTVSPCPVHSGTDSLQIVATSSTPQNTSQQIAVAPSQNYVVSAYVYQTAANEAVLKVRDTDTGNLLNLTGGGSAFITSGTANAWVLLTGTVSTLSTTRMVTLVLTNQAAGTSYWDDTNLLPTTAVNGGFEMSPLGLMSWNSGNNVTSFVAQTTNVHSGTFSLQAVTSSGGTGNVYQQVAYTPGTAHTVTVWANPGVASSAYLSVSDFTSGTPTTTLCSTAFATTGSYNQLTCTISASAAAGVKAIQINLKMSSAGT
jgi:hypothetical protein